MLKLWKRLGNRCSVTCGHHIFWRTETINKTLNFYRTVLSCKCVKGKGAKLPNIRTPSNIFWQLCCIKTMSLLQFTNLSSKLDEVAEIVRCLDGLCSFESMTHPTWLSTGGFWLCRVFLFLGVWKMIYFNTDSSFYVILPPAYAVEVMFSSCLCVCLCLSVQAITFEWVDI